MAALLDRLRHPFALRHRLEEHTGTWSAPEQPRELLPRALDPPFDHLALGRQDADLTFSLMDVDANMLHGWSPSVRLERVGKCGAQATTRGRPAASSYLPEAFTSDPDRLARFEREAKVLASLNHPHICTLHDVGSQDGVDFLVMEHLEGETVDERIQRGVLPPVELVEHGLDLLAALDALHGLGLLHRDLKPSNLILTANGLKVIDFGLTRAPATLGDDTAKTGLDLTRPGTLVGTPRFMAPEVLRGRPGSAQSDLFAVGALLYEALSGKPAFTGSSVFEIAEAVLHDNPPMLVGSDAVLAADRVVHRAMAKKAEDRYADAGAMAKDLRRILDSSDAAVSAPVTAQQVPRLIALPFRMLRPDAEFLTFSLPDAITTSLTGLTPIVVRSPLAAGDVSTDTPDLKRLAKDAEVDLVLLVCCL